MKKFWFYDLWFGLAVILPLISVQGQNGIDLIIKDVQRRVHEIHKLKTAFNAAACR